MIHAALLTLATLFPAQNAVGEPIVTLDGVSPKESVFEKASRNKPLVVRSMDEAKPYFDDQALAVLKRKVDFKQRVLLVFAWRGSGQDKLSYDVAESFPEQVSFRYQPGRTRDLRPHVHLFSLRSNVKWKVR